MILQHINPPDHYRSPVFSQGIMLPANSRILLIGGQNSIDQEGHIIGKDDAALQAKTAIANMLKVLSAAGGQLEQLVKTTIILRQDADVRAAFPAWAAVWGERPNPPVVTSIMVQALANPDFLIEIEAMAVLE